jgi:hypothetical protein
VGGGGGVWGGVGPCRHPFTADTVPRRTACSGDEYKGSAVPQPYTDPTAEGFHFHTRTAVAPLKSSSACSGALVSIF